MLIAEVSLLIEARSCPFSIQHSRFSISVIRPVLIRRTVVPFRGQRFCHQTNVYLKYVENGRILADCAGITLGL
jgi:hypothetical protein